MDLEGPARRALRYAGFGPDDVVAGPFESEEHHAVFEVSLGDADVGIVKLCTDASRREGLLLDCRVRERVSRETDLPVPDTYAADVSPDAPAAYVVLEPCDGTRLEDTYASASYEGSEELLFRVGRTLASYHEQTSVPGAGPVVPADAGGVDLETPGLDWRAALRDAFESKVARLRGTRFETAGERALDRCRFDRPELDDVDEFALLHGDFGPDNLFVGDGDVTGVIDWEEALAGPPEFDLCRTESFFFDNVRGPADEGHRDALLSGYRSVRSLSATFYKRRDLYRALLTLGSMVWFDSWAPEVDVRNDLLAQSLRKTLVEEVDAWARDDPETA